MFNDNSRNKYSLINFSTYTTYEANSYFNLIMNVYEYSNKGSKIRIFKNCKKSFISLKYIKLKEN